MLTNITWLDLCLAGVGLYFIQQMLSKKAPAPFPPGPKGLPLVGNIADMPSVKPWLTFMEWAKKYGKCPFRLCRAMPYLCVLGDIAHVEVLGQHIVVLNNVNVAIELLDKKSSSYSDRPVLPMGGELVGWKNTLVLLPYGDRFREYRKNFARVIGSRAAMDTYHPIEEIETHRFLQRVLAKPAELSQHVRHTAGAIILRISHGYEVKEHQDPFVDLADRAVEQFSTSTATGAFMVDVIPSRQCIALEGTIYLISFAYSGLCSRLVPWCEFQAQGQRMAYDARGNGSETIPIRQGSNGRFGVLSRWYMK